jgi:hypothetical protein
VRLRDRASEHCAEENIWTQEKYSKIGLQGEDANAHTHLSEDLIGKDSPARPRCKWEENIMRTAKE